MKICRFYDNKSDKRFGIVENKIIIEIEGTPFESFTIKDKKHNLDEVKLLAPCVPSKIVAIGLNQKDHAAEMYKKIPDDHNPDTALTIVQEVYRQEGLPFSQAIRLDKETKGKTILWLIRQGVLNGKIQLGGD